MTVALVILATLLTSSLAMKHDLVVKHDRRTHFLVERFGFSSNGKLKISVTDIQWHRNGALWEPRPKAGFVVMVSKAEFINLNLGKTCPFDLEKDETMRTFPWQRNSTTAFVDEIVEQEGLWSVFFVACAPAPMTVSFKLTLDQWNVFDGGKVSYLSTGEVPLPFIYGAFAVVFFLMLCFWVGYFMLAKNRKVNTVHYMMTALVVFKILALFCQSFMYATMARTGHAQGWNIAYYVFQSTRAVFLFTVVLMIGTGFAFLKAFLTDTDKKLFIIVLPLQVLANIALIVTEETMPGSSHWDVWLYIFRAVDIICCAAVLLPIVTSMNNLKTAAQTDGKARVSLEKLLLFRRFYLIVICYIYFTRIIVLLLNNTLPYSRTWIGPFFAECAAVVFYLVVGHQFRPIKENPYFHVDQEESDLIELRAREAIQNEDI